MTTMENPAASTEKPIRLPALLARAGKLAPSLVKGGGVTLGLALLGTAAQIVVPLLVQRVLDVYVVGVPADDIDVNAVGAICLGALVLLVVAVLASRAAVVRLVESSASGLADLRVQVFRHIHDLSALHVQAERRGVLVSRVTSDIEAVTHFMEWGGIGMVVGSAQVTLTVIAMFLYEWRLASLAVIAAGVYVLLLIVFQRVLQRGYDRVRIAVGESLAAISETISGLVTIRAFGAEDRSRQRVADSLDHQFREEFRIGALGAVMFSSAEVFAAGVTAGIVAAGIALADTGLTAGTLVAFVFLVTLFIEPVQLLVELLGEAQTAASGLRRVVAVLEQPLDLADPGSEGTPLPSGPIGVQFDGVGFAYGDGPVVLDHVSVMIEPTRRIAVVGETGSGKSTFAKLLVRLVEVGEGTVRLGGIDIRDVPFASLRERVAFVPQDGFLFDGDIADNIRYGRIGATDEAVEQAVRDLGLDDWIARLPLGLSTMVGERGSRLSAGERQLVALVRAWIAAPDLLVLDEATSAVDPVLEVALRHAIARLTTGRTSVTVAHRLSTAAAADEVLVFDQGRIIERGHHDDLVAAGGVYTSMFADWQEGSGAARVRTSS